MFSGFYNIDKPLGFTSHDVVAQVKRLLRQRTGEKIKVGHAGTLDPLATGVLIVCVGAATRLSEYVMHATKQYRARVHLGVTTDSYDAEGQITSERDASHITRSDIETALDGFLGEIHQVPPMHSAIKQGGKKLYELARQGQTVERAARRVRIDALTLEEYHNPHFDLLVTCSAGTYIRSLAYDLGEALGVGAHLAGLVRTQSGSFRLEDAVTLDLLVQSTDLSAYLTTPEAAFADWHTVELDTVALDHILHGRALLIDHGMAVSTLARALSPEGRMVAVLTAVPGAWQPHKVLA